MTRTGGTGIKKSVALALFLMARFLCLHARGQYYVAHTEQEAGGVGIWTLYAPVLLMEPGHMNGGVNSIAEETQQKTPLMLDAQEGNIEGVLYLLERGADTMATDKAGETALDLARRSGSERMVQILELDRVLHPPAQDYYAQREARIRIIGGDEQRGGLVGALQNLLKVQVTDEKGKPLGNAPVTFAVNGDERLLGTSHQSPSDSMLVLRTDQQGVCQVVFALPETAGWRTVTASVGREGHGGGVTFHELADPSAQYTDPFAIRNVTGSVDGPQTHVTYTWYGGSREVACIQVRTIFKNGGTRLVQTLPPTATSVTVGDDAYVSPW